ncbi:MAG: endonuclease [Bacteroidota bacterium]
MKNTKLFMPICFLFISLLLSANALGQGNETFDNFAETGSAYADGTFLGQDGSTWTYEQCRGDASINGKSIMLGRNRTPQANFYSGTITGGVGSISFNYMQAFSTNVNLNILINDVVVGNVTTSGEQNVVKNSGDFVVNVAGDVVIKFINVNNGDGQVVIDDVVWTSYSTGGNNPPSISNITQFPTENISSTSTVSVSADVIDSDGSVQGVELRWGTASDALTNIINMPLSSGDTYSSSSDIPAQANETTVYYQIFAEDNEGGTTLSPINNYFVNDPAIGSIPYYEPFDLDLGDCYVYSVLGDTKVWNYNGAGTAQINGYNSGETEEDWLILPGFTLNNNNLTLSFETWYNYGNDDASNYLKLYYSTDYAGIGDPSTATWNEITYTQPTAASTWEASGALDLSAIAGDPVWFGFKYNYQAGNYRWWQIDNIRIQDNFAPGISNIVQSPADGVISTSTVSVSADVTDDGAVSLVELRWGTAADALSNTIGMALSSGTTYTTSSDIPAQANETTVYYQIFAEDDEASTSLSTIQSYLVKDPVTTTIPYYEPFDVDLGDCYANSVSGDTKVWNHNATGTAQMNGHNSGELETDWLILPGVTLNNDDYILSFISYYDFGIDDTDNYLNLYYSTDYFGVGNPEDATWNELLFNKPSGAQQWTASGNIDLSGLAGNPVWFGFKYNYHPGNYRHWQIDNLEIKTPPAPGDGVITVSDVSLFDFKDSYVNYMSDAQFYYVSATDLTADLTVTAPTNFLVSLDCNSNFNTSLTISPIGGTISDTRVYVRFKPGSQGTFNANVTNESTGANIETVNVSGTGIANQIPAGYYNTATGIEGVLMDQLHQIIKNHTKVSYASLWNHFANTDEKFNGKVWDIYSDLRCEESPYEYIFIDDQDSGTGGGQEGDAYNREHSWPNSWWGGSTSDTMYTDIYHMYPADKHVNGQRGSYIFGQTNSPSWTSLAGHKLGNNSYGGVYTGTVFEPTDEYKGDFARTYFYMVTRYKSRLASWSTISNADIILDGSQYPAFETWVSDMLLEWHNNDPVSQKEINRNNAAYAIQGNRNPFIDNPQFVNDIWGTPAEPTIVNSIAELRQQNADAVTVYDLTSEVFLTFQQTYRNKKYIQDPDGQAAIEIDDANGIITSTYNRYDGITGIKGTLTSYNNLLQFIPVEDSGTASSTGNIVDPEIKTLTELSSNDQAKLIKVENVSFANTGTFANGTDYNISDSSGSLVFKTNFYNVDYINTAIPEAEKHITAIVYQNLDVIQITARELADFEDVALMGDVNGDGFINILDVVWMVSHINGDSPVGFILEVADINEDNNIDVSDLTMLIDMILAGAQ